MNKATTKPTKAEVDRKRKLAYTLFVENGFEQKVIAEVTGISEQSISKWKTAGNWIDDKNEARMGFEQQRRRLRNMISTQLTLIEKRKPPFNVPDSKEGDTLSKLADAARKLQTELSFAHKADAGKLFVNFIQTVHGQEKAIQIVDLWHEFLMSTT
ncbi:Phage terminase small subunit [Chitinophaga sp. YR573]|uniref:terminase gpP N-terminus-related DNA-binding protein n=1 Tax=Chitinophaga sp. YR573 TaxID=1881040 RepID=UPI0008C31FCA|nr:hypothetical protein [Chitinophaga sp. YR573]SEW02022.1 Phage terminase small subunit [Chitinophaga sp. YR573]